MNIYVLTYTSAHRKTFDVLCLLKALGYKKVFVYAKAFTYVKKYSPIISHRPNMVVYPSELSAKYICKEFDFNYTEIEKYNEIDVPEESIFLVCGAGLLPDSFIKKYNCINSHPGYIPYVRGLDAFKWAIYEKLPVGVTTHIIGDEVDAGHVIERNVVPIYMSDSFHRVAQRQYEMEICMIVEAIEKLKKPHKYFSGKDYTIHKRMPNFIEKKLFKAFEEYKTKFSDVTSETNKLK